MEAAAAVKVRRHDLDWLRVIGVLTVFVYHSMSFFRLEDWSVKNGVTYAWVEWPMGLLALWMMPLIFVVSGASIYYASRKGGAGGFLKDKVLRLFVPLAVGALTFSAGQVYVERVSHGQFHGSFYAFIPHYFEGLYLPGTTGNFAFHGMHLWYLMVLFIFTVVLAPLFFWLRGDAGVRFLKRIGGLLALPGAIVLLALPTVVLQNLSESGPLEFGLGGWRLVQYVWFLLAGYLIVSDERVQARVVQARWVAFVLAAGYVLQSLVTGSHLYAHPDLVVWALLIAVLGFGMKHLTFENRFLGYANEGVLPFYILHQTVLLIIGFFVVGWAIPDAAKYVVIAGSSFAAIVLLYEGVVRRADVVRVLFGMKPRPAMPARAAVLEEEQAVGA